jgi:hypothetical protein
MQVLNKYDKEEIIIKLHQEGKTMREDISPAFATDSAFAADKPRTAKLGPENLSCIYFTSL